MSLMFCFELSIIKIVGGECWLSVQYYSIASTANHNIRNCGN